MKAAITTLKQRCLGKEKSFVDSVELLICKRRRCWRLDFYKTNLRSAVTVVARVIKVRERFGEQYRILGRRRFSQDFERLLGGCYQLDGYIAIKHRGLTEGLFDLADFEICQVPVSSAAGIPKLNMAQLRQSHDVAEGTCVRLAGRLRPFGMGSGERHIIAKRRN